MSKNPFTDEQLAAIRANPNVEKASPISVKFTEAFKERAYRELNDGKPVLDVFRDAGFDTNALGMYRMRGFKDKLMYRATKGEGFKDRRKDNYRRSLRTGSETVEQRVKQLENELAYTRQEVEFLKKIQTANMEAQKQWESRHRQK